MPWTAIWQDYNSAGVDTLSGNWTPTDTNRQRNSNFTLHKSSQGSQCNCGPNQQ